MPTKFSTRLYSKRYIFLNPLTYLILLIELLSFIFSLLGPRQVYQLVCWIIRGRHDLVHIDVMGEGETVCDLLSRSIRVYPSRVCYRERQFLGYREDKLVFHDLIHDLTYREVDDRIRSLASGFRHLGVKPLTTDPKNSFNIFIKGESKDELDEFRESVIMIYEDTSVEFSLTACASMFSSYILATSYSTLGIDSFVIAMNETKAGLLVCNRKNVEELVERKMNGELPYLHTIVYTMHYATQKYKNNSNFKVVEFSEVIEMGKKNPAKLIRPGRDTVALIMYTSGSSGTPKGVVMTHRNIHAATTAYVSNMNSLHQYKKQARREQTPFDGPEHLCYLAYLPAAHILEFIAEISILVQGGQLSFACPRTITNEHCCILDRSKVGVDLENISEDLYDFSSRAGAIRVFRPYIFCGVPKIFDIIKGKIEERLKTPLQRYFVSLAVYFRTYSFPVMDYSFLNWLVYKRFYREFGGRIQLFVSGGGALSRETQKFLRGCFHKTGFIQGYALTETSASATCQYLFDLSSGNVGYPTKAVSLTLQSIPDLEDSSGFLYKTTDRKHFKENCLGRGEIFIRGPSVALGYLFQFEETKRSFYLETQEDALTLTGKSMNTHGSKEGKVDLFTRRYPYLHDKGSETDPYAGYPWFRTGDVGVFTNSGRVKIVDRVKNLVKLRGGEYVRIEYMESIYNQDRYVQNFNGGIMCYGDSEIDRPVAFVQVDMNQLKTMDPNSDKVRDKVLKSLQRTGISGGLSKNEIISKIAIFAGDESSTVGRHSAWNPENNFLTPSNKLNRRRIQKEYSELLEKLKT